LELGRHHFPEASVDLLYLTPPMIIEQPEIPEGARFTHLTWNDVRPLIDEAWGGSPHERERVLAERLMHEIGGLTTPASVWRATSGIVVSAPDLTVPPRLLDGEEDAVGDPTDAAIALAIQVENDQTQRAVEYRASGVDELLALRLRLRDALAAPASRAPHVRPWIWRWASTGQPLTDAGCETGYELRFSHYRDP
jgi:hypothetical protein